MRAELRCSCYKVVQRDSNDFDDGYFTKRNVKKATVKRVKAENAPHMVDRMATTKLKYQDGRKCKGVRKARDGRDNHGRKNRKNSGRAKSVETRCNMNIKLHMSRLDGSWYLGKRSNLQHAFHPPLPPQARLMNESHLSEQEKKWVEQMHHSGISDGNIANIMNGYFETDGRMGEFLPDTVKNITNKMDRAMEKVASISPDFSVAEKTLAWLSS